MSDALIITAWIIGSGPLSVLIADTIRVMGRG